MKTLSVKQPWAWAIAKGYKTIENRSRATSHRGPLAIHASQRWDEPKQLWLANAVSIARNQGHTLPARLADDMPYSDTGLVIAIVDVTGVCTASRDEPTVVWDYYDRLVYVPGSQFPVTEDRPAGKAMPDLLGREVTYEPHIDVIRHDLRMRAWTPTQADILADDWVLAESNTTGQP